MSSYFDYFRQKLGKKAFWERLEDEPKSLIFNRAKSVGKHIDENDLDEETMVRILCVEMSWYLEGKKNQIV